MSCGNDKCQCNEPDEAQRLQREATKSRAGSALGPTVANESDDSPQPGTEDVPDA